MPETWLQLGVVSVVLIAVKQLSEMVINAYNRREWKKNGASNGLYTIDPTSGEPILLPALNFRMLTELTKAEADHAAALHEIVDVIHTHDQPILDTAQHCKEMSDKLMTPDEAEDRMRRAVRTELRGKGP